jgi:glucose/arabinose dehydrogenase
LQAQNLPPATPIITEPATDGEVVNAEDVHMETGPFSDPNPGDTHRCTDWAIWTVNPSQRVWFIDCISGVERLHTHLGDGSFEGSHAGRSSLLPETQFELRVRHRDSSGVAATEWSNWATRPFSTGPLSEVFPLELEDVAATPTPTWQDTTGSPIVLPGGATPPMLRLESAGGALLLEIRGLDGFANVLTNPPALAAHAVVRIRIDAAPGATLSLAESDMALTDGNGQDRTIYLPAVLVSAAESAFFWVSTNGSTYVGDASQTAPDFSQLARGAAVPWTLPQPGYRVEIVATGFQLPVNIAFPAGPGPDPDDPYFYVTELYGRIKVVLRDGTVQTYAENLLNFNPTGNFPGSGEQGLTGICVDAANGDVYATLLYDAGGPHYPKVVRFTSSDGGHSAGTQTTILDMVGESQGQSHQISNISFGPDGKLYVHMGDGFDASTAQNLNSFRGKILRLNKDGTAPGDNPFYNAGDGINARDYVYAYGFRNPFGGAWRASDGAHYEVENGPSVDRFAKVVAGRNYLWDGSNNSMFNFAIYVWNPARAPVNIGFIHPSVFGGSLFPSDKMDHAFVTLSGATWASGPGKEIVEFTLDANGDLVAGPTPFIQYNGSGKASCVGLAAGPDGLYFTDFYKDVGYTSPIDPGANVLRIKYVGQVAFAADATAGPAPLTVHFTDLSTVPAPTAWLWSFGDGATSTQQNPAHTYTQDGVYNVRLSVDSPNGLVVRQQNAYIRVGDVHFVALIGGADPPSASDEAVADYLRGLGYTVDTYDDDPANRPSAAELASGYGVVVVSSTAASGNIAGEFRDQGVPLVFWEQALLRIGREALLDYGAVAAATQIDIQDADHPITAGLPLGPATVFSAAVNMSVGRGNIGPDARVLATRTGSPGDATIVVAEAGGLLLGGYVAPARRVFLFLEDSSWLSATATTRLILDRAVRWAIGIATPCPGDTNGDRVVDNGDLQAILDAWASQTGDPDYDASADLNGDGIVENTDLQEVIDHWARTCP